MRAITRLSDRLAVCPARSGRLRLLLACCLLTLLTGCGSPAMQPITNNVDFDFASQPTFYTNNWVRRSPVQIYVHPDMSPATPPTALFLPLRLTQGMEHASWLSGNISRLFWQTWLQGRVFSTLEFAETTNPYRPDMALGMGAARGADYVVGGYITYFMDGGTTGESKVSIAIEAYEVRTGNLMWSMAQSAYMPRAKVNDYLLFAVKSRMPTDPAAAVITAVAADMGKEIYTWIHPEEKKSLRDKITEPSAF